MKRRSSLAPRCCPSWSVRSQHRDPWKLSKRKPSPPDCPIVWSMLTGHFLSSKQNTLTHSSPRHCYRQIAICITTFCFLLCCISFLPSLSLLVAFGVCSQSVKNPLGGLFGVCVVVCPALDLFQHRPCYHKFFFYDHKTLNSVYVII